MGRFDCQAPARMDPQALIAAAVLAGGPTAVASHGSAAWLWGWLPHDQPPPEISLPTGDRRPRRILTHRCPSLQPRDVTRQHGVPTTAPARTALDLAPRLGHTQLTRLVNDTDSSFEDDFKAFVATYGLPTPLYNHPYNGRRLDVCFAQYGVIVELDGWDYHKDRDSFEDDRERDADHLDHDLVTVRITRPRFAGQPDHEAARLIRILRKAGWQPT